MAKQRQIDLLDDDNELDMEMDTEFEHDLDGDLDVDLDEEVSAVPTAEAAPPTPALTPEAALEFLLNLGRTQGYVSYDDVLQVMPEAESNMEQLEDTFASLFEQGIEV